MVDWSVFNKASPPAAGDPTRVYRAEDFDFSLVAGSAAIDAGVALPGITDGFTGSAPDLGAIEFGKPAPKYGPRPVAQKP